MGSVIRRYLHKTLAILLCICLLITYTPTPASAASLGGAGGNTNDQTSQAKDVNLLDTNGEAQTTIQVMTYSTDITAQFGEALNTAYTINELVRGDNGNGIKLSVDAFGGNGSDTLQFEWSYICKEEAGQPVHKIDGELASKVVVPPVDGGGIRTSKLNLGVLAADNNKYIEDDKNYVFTCKITSPKTSPTGRDFVKELTYSLYTIANGSYSYKTLYSNGTHEDISGNNLSYADFNVDANRAGNANTPIASISGNMFVNAEVLASEIPADQASSLLSVLPSDAVMGKAYSVTLHSNATNGISFIEGPAKLTLPVAEIPENAANIVDGSNVMILGFDKNGNPTCWDGSDSTRPAPTIAINGANKYVQFPVQLEEVGSFVIAFKAKPSSDPSTKQFTVNATIADNGTGQDGGTVQPELEFEADGTSKPQNYLVGNSAPYKFFADTANRFEVGQIVVEVVEAGDKFVYSDGNIEVNGNKNPNQILLGRLDSYGIAFAGNGVTFAPSDEFTFNLSVKFDQLPEVGGEEDPAEKATVTAEIKSGDGAVTINGVPESGAGKIATFPPAGQDFFEGQTVSVKVSALNHAIDSVKVNGKAWFAEGMLVTFAAKAGENTVEINLRQGSPTIEKFNVFASVDPASAQFGELKTDAAQTVDKTGVATVEYAVKNATDGSANYRIDHIEDYLVDKDNNLLDATAKPKVTYYGTHDAPVLSVSHEVSNVVAHHRIVAYFTEILPNADVEIYVAGGEGIVVANGEKVTIGSDGAATIKLRKNQQLKLELTAGVGYKVPESIRAGRNTVSISNGIFTMVGDGKDTTITITFPQDQASEPIEDPAKQYNIVLAPGVGGDITPHMTSLPAGQSQKFNFVPDDGMKLDRAFLQKGNAASEEITVTNGVYNLENIQSDVKISATWIKGTSTEEQTDTVQLTTTANTPGGYLDPKTGPVLKGSSPIIYINALENYTLDVNSVKAEKIVDGSTVQETLEVVKVSDGVWRTVLAGIDVDTTVSASFTYTGQGESKYCSVTTIAGENGAISPSGISSVKRGSDFDFTVNPNAGYKIASIQVTSGGSSSGLDVTKNSQVVSVNADTTIEATFAPTGNPGNGAGHITDSDLVTVLTGVEGAGRISPSNPEVKAGASKNFTFEPANGYELTDIKVGRKGAAAQSISAADLVNAIAAGCVYKLENIVSGDSIIGVFTQKSQDVPTYSTVTFNSPANGTLKVYSDGTELASGNTVQNGKTITIALAPAEGYEIDHLKLNGSTITGATASNAWRMNGNVNIEAAFKKKSETPGPGPDDPGETTQLGERKISTKVGKQFQVTADLPGTHTGTVEWKLSERGGAFAAYNPTGLTTADGKTSFTHAGFSQAGTYIFIASLKETVGGKEVVYQQQITVTVEEAASGDNSGTTTVEPPIEGPGSGGTVTPTDPTKPSGGSTVEVETPETPAGKTVKTIEWFVSTDGGNSYKKVYSADSSDSNFDPDKYADDNLPDGEYVFKCEVTYTDNDRLIQTYKVKVGTESNNTEDKDPGAGIPSGDIKTDNNGDPIGTNSPSDVSVNDKGGTSIKPSIGNEGDQRDWYISDDDGKTWTKLPNTDKFPGMVPNEETGELDISPDVNPDDYKFQVIVKDKEDGTNTKQELDITVKNDTPGIDDGIKIAPKQSVSIAKNEGALLVPVYVSSSPNNEWWVFAEGANSAGSAGGVGSAGKYVKLPLTGGDASNPAYSTAYGSIKKDAEGNLVIPADGLSVGSHMFRVITKDANGKPIERQDFSVNKADAEVEDDGTGSAGSIAVPSPVAPIEGNGTITPSYPSDTASSTKWFLKSGSGEFKPIDTPAGGVEQLALDLPAGNYVACVVTFVDGNAFKQYFPIDIDAVDTNITIPAEETPSDLVDVNVSVSVKAEVKTNVSVGGGSQGVLSAEPHGVVSPNGTFKVVYDTQNPQTKTFYIYPNKGWYAKSVIVNDKDFTSQMKGFRPDSSKQRNANGGFNPLALFGVGSSHADDAGLVPDEVFECYTVDVPIASDVVKNNEVDFYVDFEKLPEGYSGTVVSAGDVYSVNPSIINGVVYPNATVTIPAGQKVDFVSWPKAKGLPIKKITAGTKEIKPRLNKNNSHAIEFEVDSSYFESGSGAAVQAAGIAAQAEDALAIGELPLRIEYADVASHEVKGAVTPAGAGTISPQVVSVQNGASATFTITANEGYVLSHMLVGSEVARATKNDDGTWSYTINNVTAPVTVTAVFISEGEVVTPVVLHSITASVEGGHGSVSPTYAEVAEGKSKTFTFTPDAGYAVKSLTIDGKESSSFAGTNSYTFSDVKENHTLVVKFEPSTSGGGVIKRAMRTLNSLAQTGDLNAPIMLMLMTVACGALGVAILTNGRKRRFSDGGNGRHAENAAHAKK